jgi:hypothetical protein
LVVATAGTAQPRERARPVADIVNPWAAGDAAIQRLLDECVALRENGSNVDPLDRDVIRGKPACEMFRPRRILAALPTADE